MNVACNLTNVRESKGMTQAELGEKVGVSQQMIYQLEKGLRVLSVPMLISISEALECTPNDILGFNNERSFNHE
jgi:transcriptional regulator with XRE-family HTH domain